MNEKLLKELKRIKEVKAIYLFGSHAAGKATPISDIDICAITDRDISKDKKADITSCSNDKLDISVFWDLPIMIRYRVLKEGKPLFERDKKFLHNITIATLREYLDFKPVIERFSEVYFGDKRWIEKG